jgi:pre-rRNA-processing protein TSR3
MKAPPTMIWRHRRENLKKCSLRALSERSDLKILTYPIDPLPDLSSYLMLKVGAPPLTKEDHLYGLLLLDATWRLATIMERQCPVLPTRSLPRAIRTAYPRRSTDCPDPVVGLATIEAMYAAYRVLGRSTEGLLTSYEWAAQFLVINQQFDWARAGE